MNKDTCDFPPNHPFLMIFLRIITFVKRHNDEPPSGALPVNKILSKIGCMISKA